MSILDRHHSDAPIFDPAAFRLADAEADLIERARRFGARVLAPRAAEHDRAATFPIENFRDMHGEGLLAICVPRAEGGSGQASAPIAWPPPSSAAIAARPRCPGTCTSARRCGPARSPTSSSSRPPSAPSTIARRSLHYRRIVHDGTIYSQPFSEGGAAAAGVVAFGTEARPVDGGFVVTGKKIFASLSGAADYYGVLCTERGEDEAASRRNTLYLAVPANAPGVSVVGDWDPLGMRARCRARCCSRTCSCPRTRC